ncbi:MAG: hypothetical protein H6987_18700 [Pseudomonadales bacterium]|nr:hypothetical protein [Pseudomonadales bacterium]MCP5167640.1 hypothetical protein [Pseudomonadales bacterium]MCP5195092.1 hypothetical protein [Pseudomonadales bacterium]
MSDLEYPACINELYQSEVLGEKAFLALMAAAKNEREKYHFGTFLQLESETKVRLRPFLQRYGMPFIEEPSSGEEVAGFVALYQQSSWQDFLAALKPMIDQFLGQFQEIADAGPTEDQDVLQSMVTHEKSYVYWIEKELAGEAGSLDAAISQLQYPLAAQADAD